MSQRTFTSSHPYYEYLRKKWIAKRQHLSENFLRKHETSIRHLVLGGLGGLMLATTPGGSTALTLPTLTDGVNITKAEDKNAELAASLKDQVPTEVRKLTTEEEEKISRVLSDNLGVSIKSQINDIRLNRSYGLIGGEQHLYRYPGDSLFKHAESVADWVMYGPAGIAPGLGAWGYFSPAKAEFTKQDRDRERFYIAVQTFLAPGFAENVDQYRAFFKFRKMVVVNPQTGQSVVAVIGDAGPAEWTGKHLGGSPEVMYYLGWATGPRQGPVLYFFIDDPEDMIPLGPIIAREVRL